MFKICCFDDCNASGIYVINDGLRFAVEVGSFVLCLIFYQFFECHPERFNKFQTFHGC